MYTNNYSNSVSTNSLYKVYSWMMVGLWNYGNHFGLVVCFRHIHAYYSDSHDFTIIIHSTNFVNDFNGTSIIT